MRSAIRDGARRVGTAAPPHPRWQAQLDLLAADPPAADGDDPALLAAVVALVSRLPEIPAVMPAPGQQAVGDAAATAQLDRRMLTRVRALLAKAESTEFDEEAEALTAKAQELITRHAIVDALAHGSDDTHAAVLRRVPVDPPYADAKSSLLAVVSDANRCRAVHSPDLGWVTILGHDGDLDAVELVGTSLLTQATHAIARHGTRTGRDGRSTTRSFRRAFLYGFAARIGERLRDAADAGIASAAVPGARLLPVLAARDDRVEAALREAFPEVDTRRARISNATGWSSGRAAADLAELGVRRPIRGT